TPTSADQQRPTPKPCIRLLRCMKWKDHSCDIPSRHFPGESAKYQCWQNFKMTGASTVMCQNGTWTEPAMCSDISRGRCGSPPTIRSDTVEYKCPDFYILKGSPTITCNNGLWTSPPVCVGRWKHGGCWVAKLCDCSSCPFLRP
uniref:Sushi domain-containing protein n=1 Tax=Malurus cyaneus samueli TaxID=2593467 RepID=A0A8C5UII2_9PASS